jgi:hypothetical protein
MATERGNRGRQQAAPKKEPFIREPRPEVSVEDGVAQVCALNKVTYGAGQTAPARSIFTPVSEAERNELLACGAVRELTEDEAKIFAVAPAADPSDVIA